MYVEKTKNLLSFADVPKEMAKEKKKGGSGGGRVSVVTNGRLISVIQRGGSKNDAIYLGSLSVRKEATWMILSTTIPTRSCH